MDIALLHTVICANPAEANYFCFAVAGASVIIAVKHVMLITCCY